MYLIPFLIFLLLELLPTQGAIAQAAQPVSNPAPLTPAGTKIVVKVVTPISSGDAKAGDPFVLSVEEDVIIEQNVVIHSGDSFVGTIKPVKSVRAFTPIGHGGYGFTRRPGLELKFESLVSADGSRVPVVASFATHGRRLDVWREPKKLTFLVPSAAQPQLLGLGMSYSPPSKWGPKARRESRQGKMEQMANTLGVSTDALAPPPAQTLINPAGGQVRLLPGDETKVLLKKEIRLPVAAD